MMRNYSYLSASIGSRFAALAAGSIPNRTPTNPENPRDRKIAHGGITAGGKSGILLEISVPKP